MKLLNMAGKTFGKWSVLSRSLPNDSKGQAVWDCRCVCGRTARITGNNLKWAKTTGCFICNRRRPKTPRPTNRQLLKNSTRNSSGCRIWNGSLSQKGKWGYAIVFFHTKEKCQHRVCRILFENLLKRNLSSKEFICHRCDNPMCINPRHLFLGSARLNALDMIEKGRNAKGELSGSSKLTNRQIVLIRESKKTHCALAEEFKVSKSAIGAIKLMQSWKHIPWVKDGAIVDRLYK